jgi:hypothetical protein
MWVSGLGGETKALWSLKVKLFEAGGCFLVDFEFLSNFFGEIVTDGA